MAKTNNTAPTKKRPRGRPKKTLEQKARELFSAYKDMTDEQIREAMPRWFCCGPPKLTPLADDLLAVLSESEKRLMQGYVGNGLSVGEVALLHDEGLDTLSPSELDRVLAPIRKKLAAIEQKKTEGSREGAQRRTRASRKKWESIFNKAKQSGIQFGKPHQTAKLILKKWAQLSSSLPTSERSIAEAIKKLGLCNPK
jgi:flagellar biosynthesis/type III secretory pathway protein FliH